MPTDPDDDNDDDDGLLLEEQPAPLPRRIPGQKLDRQGTYTPYHGFSMVYPLRGTGTAPPEDGMLRSRPHKWLPTHPADEAWSALPALVRRFAGSKYVPLPASSYHVTLLDGITAEKACGKDFAPDTIAPNDAWDAYLGARSARLAGANTLVGFHDWRATDDPLAGAAVHGPRPFVPSLILKEVEVQGWGISCVFEMAKSSEEAAAAQLDAALVRVLGRDKGRQWNFHLTLAYKRPGADEDEDEDDDDDDGGGGGRGGRELGRVERDGRRRRDAATQLTKAVLKTLGDAPLPLEPARACCFVDMARFPPWVMPATTQTQTGSTATDGVGGGGAAAPAGDVEPVKAGGGGKSARSPPPFLPDVK